jgi:histidinol-phosphate aminotransferase
MNPQVFVARPPLPPGASITHLDGNENHFIGPFNRYPDPESRRLREAYSRYLTREAAERGAGLCADLDTEMLLPTRGSLESFDLLLRAFCEPGQDAICISEPAFPMYAHWARAYRIDVVDVPLEGENLDRLDIDGMSATRAKLVFVTRPHNPLGNTVPLATLADLACRVTGLLVVDEAYIEFSTQPSCATLLERHPNIVVTRTLSKAWGQAALRVGMLIAEPSILESVQRILDPYHVPVPSSDGIVAVLERSEGVELTWRRIREERERVRDRLGRSPSVRKVYPSDTNFLLIEVDEPDLLMQRFLAERIVVRPTQATGRPAIRLTLGLPHENERALGVLEG